MLQETKPTAGAVAAGLVPAARGVLHPTETLTLRPGRPEDARECGRICFEAFRDIAAKHAFPEDFPTAEAASDLFRFALAQSDTHVVVAELAGRVVGSNMAWEQTPVTGVGPITVEPGIQNAAVGRHLMQYVLDRTKERSGLGIRLVQAAYHNRSLALYTKLGFDAREPLTVFQGSPLGQAASDRGVRPAGARDLEACAKLHQRLQGFDRAGDLALALAQGTAKVVERKGLITGYTAGIGFFGHSVGESNRDIMALISEASSIAGPGFLVPTRNATLVRWCLDNGLRIVQPMTLMTKGFYRKPRGAYLPSILF